MSIKDLSVKVLVWRLGLFAAALVGMHLIPYRPTFPYAYELLPEYGSHLITAWAGFDGVHYLTILREGYESSGIVQAFFPLFPLMVKLVSLNQLINPIVVGLVLSTGFLIGAVYFLDKLIRMDYSDRIAKKVLIALLLFPTAFYFGAFYTESLFLFTVVASLYAARKNRWWLAGVLGALASATRVTGILILPMLILEYYRLKGVEKAYSPKAWLPLFLPLVGIGTYIVYLWVNFGDPFLFYTVQADFGVGRETERFILLPQVFYRYLSMIITVSPTHYIYWPMIQEFFWGVVITVAGIVSLAKLRSSYSLFLVASFVIPSLTGTFTSLPRYILPVFPLFLLMALYLPGKYYRVWIVVSAILLAINTALFVQGWWIA